MLDVICLPFKLFSNGATSVKLDNHVLKHMERQSDHKQTKELSKKNKTKNKQTNKSFSVKVAPACLELTNNNAGEHILVAIVCQVEEDEDEELAVAKCCSHGQQLTGDHRGCMSHNGKGSLPPRWPLGCPYIPKTFTSGLRLRT